MTSTPSPLKPALPELEILVRFWMEESSQESLRVSRHFWDSDRDAQEMERLQEEFRSDYARSVEQVRAAWGAPLFEGTRKDEGFPVWSTCLKIAVWRRRGLFAYVGFEHQQQEVPMMVVVGVYQELLMR